MSGGRNHVRYSGEDLMKVLDGLTRAGSLFSTVGDTMWAATPTTPTTITILDALAAPLVIDDQDIVAVTRKVPGRSTPMDIWVRSRDLVWEYDNATGTLTMEGVVLDTTDLVEVYWEGQEKAVGVEGESPSGMSGEVYLAQPGAKGVSVLPAPVATGKLVQILADLYGRPMSAAFTLTSQSDRNEEIKPLNTKYNPGPNVDVTGIDALTTYYYPSATGDTIDSWKDWDLHGYIIAGTDGENETTMKVYLDLSSGMEISGARQWESSSLVGYVVGSASDPTDGDQTIRELGEDALLTSVGTDYASRVIDCDNINTKYWRLRVVTTGTAPDTTLGEYHFWPRRKAH